MVQLSVVWKVEYSAEKKVVWKVALLVASLVEWTAECSVAWKAGCLVAQKAAAREHLLVVNSAERTAEQTVDQSVASKVVETVGR